MTENTNTNNQESLINTEAVVAQVGQDLKHSILIVSLVVNLLVLTAWVALQVTASYDSAVAGFIFNR